MARAYLAVTTKGDQIMGELPLTVDGTLDWILGDYASSQFTLNVLDESLPGNWEALIEPQKMSIWVLDSDFAEPLWAGTITDVPRTGNGSVTINCLSFEGYLANRHVGDAVYNNMDPMLTVQKIIEDWVDNVETDSGGAAYVTGLGFEFDIVMSGVTRSIDFDKSNYRSVLDVIKDWALSNEFEWTILPKRTADGLGLRKVFYARYKYVGVVTDTPNHEFIMGGNVSACTYTVATNGGAYATRLTATGDGSGALQTTSQPVTNYDHERSGYPRIEMQKSYPGVAYTDDLQYLANYDAPSLWTKHEIITVDAHDNGATNLTNVGRGDSVKVTIKSVEIVRSKVMRMVGFSVGNDSAAFKPVLAELGTSPARFARAVDPMTDRKAIEDANRIDAAINRDTNDVYVPFADGTGAWTIDPEGGFGSMNPDGSFGSIKDEVRAIVPNTFFRRDTNGQAVGVGTNEQGEPLDALVTNSQNFMFWNGSAVVAQLGAGDEGTGGFLGRRDFVALGAGTVTGVDVEDRINLRGHVMKFWDTGEYAIGNLHRVQDQSVGTGFKDKLFGKKIEIGNLIGSYVDVPVDGDWVTESVTISGDNVALYSADSDMFLSAGGDYKIKMSKAEFVDGLTVDRGFTSLPGSSFNVNGDMTSTGTLYVYSVSTQIKSFVQVHPRDKTKKVTYRATESRVNGIEDFGDVTLDDTGTGIVPLKEEFDAIMKAGVMNVQLTQHGGRVVQCPSWDDGEGANFIVYGSPNATIDWVIKSAREALDKDGNDTLANEVISDNDLPDFMQPDYVAPPVPERDEN